MMIIMRFIQENFTSWHSILVVSLYVCTIYKQLRPTSILGQEGHPIIFQMSTIFRRSRILDRLSGLERYLRFSILLFDCAG